MNDPTDIPTEPGIYRDAHGDQWVYIPENAAPGFYGFRDGRAVCIQPHLAGLDFLRSRRPYTELGA